MGFVLDFFKSIFGICQTKALSTDLWHLEGGSARIPIHKVPEFQGPEGAVYLEGKGIKFPVLVVKTKDNAYLGFVNRCTHMGHRKLDPVSDKSILRCCSVSHSTYDLQGRRLS